MINQVNEIDRFFERLGLKISIEKVASKNPQTAKCYVLEYEVSDKIFAERFFKLMSAYFGDDVRSVGFARVTVMLEDFRPEGYNNGICKRCGCSNNDACPDQETGTCWWVLEDVCSACATEEEKKVAIDAMRKEMEGNNAIE